MVDIIEPEPKLIKFCHYRQHFAPLDSFGSDISKPDKKYSLCKECVKLKNKIYYINKKCRKHNREITDKEYTVLANELSRALHVPCEDKEK